MTDPIHIISLGAGVQSSTMALMAAHGEITPMPKCAIFADTQAEPKSVYTWLDWLEKQLPFPVHRVTRGNLREASLKVCRSKRSGMLYLKRLIPCYVINPDGSKGIMGRTCTMDYKITMLVRAARSMCDWRRGEKRHLVNMWIGISTDEAIRMKPSRNAFIENRWPLIDSGISRNDCFRWMKNMGYPEPPRSACTFCPFHSDDEWKRIKSCKEEWEDVVLYERQLQEAAKKQDAMKGVPYLHSSCKPIESIEFESVPSHHQISLFGNECEGMCGV